jgi:hypothetical protein
MYFESCGLSYWNFFQVRALLTTAIFRKSLKLSAAGQGKVGSSKDDSSAQSSTGQIVNLISNGLAFMLIINASHIIQ